LLAAILRRGFAQFKLVTHFLKARSKRFNLLLLLHKLRLKVLRELLYFAVLFEELVVPPQPQDRDYFGDLLKDVQRHHRGESPMLHSTEGEFSGLIDLWERGRCRRALRD